MDDLWEMDFIFFFKTGSHVYQGSLELAMFSSCVLITFFIIETRYLQEQFQEGRAYSAHRLRVQCMMGEKW